MAEGKLMDLLELVRMKQPWEKISYEAISIFNACFFLLWGKKILAWSELQVELFHKEDYFLDQLTCFDKTTLITKSIKEKELKRVKTELENASLQSMKESQFYDLLKALYAWADSQIKFYEEWENAFEQTLIEDQ